jgi:ethanolamine permease
LSFKFTLVITFVALAILIVFFLGAVSHFDFATNALNIEPGPGNSAFLPFGVAGILASLPFAIWFFLAIEQLPLAAEEAHDPKRDMPRGLLLGILTLITLAFLTLFLSAGMAPGAKEIGTSTEPLFLGFQTIFGDGIGVKLLAVTAAAGLIASFHAIIYAYGRNIYSLARAGYFPKWLSVTHGERKTPHVALFAGAALGFLVALAMQFSGSKLVGAALLNMAVFGAMISYIMQLASFILLRSKLPGIERPFVSPLGVPGAALALVIAIVTFVSLFFNPDYLPGVWGCAIWFLIGIAYFGLYGRHHLVKSPEEAFAIGHRSRKSGAVPGMAD